MKINALLLIALPAVAFAQDGLGNNLSEYPNTYSSGSANVRPFDNTSRLFKDWSISVGGGTSLMPFADLTSSYGDKNRYGWTAYASINKAITHSFALNLQYGIGKTEQAGQLPGVWGQKAGVAEAWTKYQSISLLGDVNLSNLLRRVDNNSPFRWSLHGYGGLGILKYNTYLTDNYVFPASKPLEIDQPFAIGSIFFQVGTGVRYNISEALDIEARIMYLKSGDDEFDGGGWARNSTASMEYNLINDTYSDDIVNLSLGLNFKIGKNDTHLNWYDPMQNLYYKVEELEKKAFTPVVCSAGDNDNDGVCDDWDRELNTPAGARVDGAGVALDMDLDGVIDLNDRCVTVPGPVENGGCPTR